MSSTGIYVAAAGGMAQYERLEHLTNNMANVGTTGFKADRPVFAVERPDYSGQLRNPPAPGSVDERKALAFASLDHVAVDLSLGTFETTGNPLDLAIGGDGFFAVASPEGTLFTRAGALQRSADGQLVTRSGMPVLSENGSEIDLPPGEVVIDELGEVHVAGSSVGRLQVATFGEGVQLERVGHTLFRAVGGDGSGAPVEQSKSPQVMQGVLESSNVNPVKAMVELIATNRAFEQFTKSMQTMDQLDEKAIGQMARPG